MITHPAFRWLHLPRTGGTSTALWMRSLEGYTSGKLQIDSCQQVEKHDNLAIRSYREGIEIKPACIAVNFRPLIDWLLSNYHWAHAAGLKVPLERYLEGEFFSLRMGAWVAADWWIDYFKIDSGTHFLRCNLLEEDWRFFLEEVAGITVPQILKMPYANSSGGDLSESIYTCDDRLKSAFERNPKWIAIQKRLFEKQTTKLRP